MEWKMKVRLIKKRRGEEEGGGESTNISQHHKSKHTNTSMERERGERRSGCGRPYIVIAAARVGIRET